MKRKIISIVLSATMLLGAFSLSACANTELEAKLEELQTKIEQLQDKNEELQAQIEELKQNNEEEKESLKYYISRYKNFCTLFEAYSMGLINKEELLSIAYYNGDQYVNTPQSPNDKGLMTENYKPIPKTPEVLSKETELKIKQIKASKDSTYSTTYNAEDYIITHYLGTYNECVVVVIKNNALKYDYTLESTTMSLDGVHITNRSDGYELRVFVKV